MPAACVIDVPARIRHPKSIVTIERVRIGNNVVLHLVGRMDVDGATYFEPECDSCIADGFATLIVDFSSLAYISSMGLRSVVTVAKKLKDKGGELRICGLTGLVRQVFEITRLVQLFPIYDSVELALAKD